MISYTPQSDSSYVPESAIYPAETGEALLISADLGITTDKKRLLIFAISIFLVSVPVFFQAPLVRFLPWVSLLATPVLFAISQRLLKRPATQVWGDLLLGFTWTWLSGSLYWGWLRWEPFLHLPVEAIGLPFALWGVRYHRNRIGNFFYLGSLFGTTVTDLYFYVVDLIPYWRSLMRVENDLISSIFQHAVAQVETPWGVSWAAMLALLLVVVTILPLRSQKSYWWAFSGAVLSTILVDSLFWLAAATA